MKKFFNHSFINSYVHIYLEDVSGQSSGFDF